LLMDEPLGALDKKLRQQMQLEIKHLHEQLGITVIYVTHDQEEALVMSDEVVVMRDGRVEQTGSPRDVYEHPANHFVADFIGETNFLEGTIIDTDGGGYRVRTAGKLELLATGPPGLGPGQPMTMIIRPERARFAGAAKTDNCAEASVEEVVFAGEVLRYLLRLASGEVLVLKRPNDSQVPGHGRNDRVVVRIEPEDIRLLPPRGA
jgi:ABC-type Fe3+/spermidine/putrescine transport system ATPase subunit